MAHIHIVVNPAAGQSDSETVLAQRVLPLLAERGREYTVHATTPAGVGVQAGKDVARAAHAQSQSRADGDGDGDVDIEVVLLGGDGTAQEVIQGIHAVEYENEALSDGSRAGRRYRLAILPCGTANALHSSLYPADGPDVSSSSSSRDPYYASLEALLAGRDPRPLTLSYIDIRAPSPSTSPAPASSHAHTPPRPTPSHVVLSTALHANLLLTADELRASHPGIERFKLAAERNSRIFHPATVRLFPPSSGSGSGSRGVRRYDPHAGAFLPVPPSAFGSGAPHDLDASPGRSEGADDDAAGVLELQGPFSYFLATTNVDRLEPQFVVSPLIRRLPKQEDETDVIVLRPGRDPLIATIVSSASSTAAGPASASASAPDRETLMTAADWEAADEATKDAALAAWPARAQAAIMRAYDKGSHVDLVYPSSSSSSSSSSSQAGDVAGQFVLASEDASGDGAPVVEVYRCGGWEWRPTDATHGPSHNVCVDGSPLVIPPGGSARVTLNSPPGRGAPLSDAPASGPRFAVYM